MKKILSIIAVSAATLVLTTGCSATSKGVDDLQMSAKAHGDATMCKTAIYVGDRSSEKVLDAIKEAGQSKGWRMTPFKSNAIIAEKMIDGKMYATTITIAKEHITCSKNGLPQSELDDLRSTIVKEIKKEDIH